ncbi:MAG: LacI family DNA-binding transcriptional regulator [Eubacteriales bacterium]|nr:LacI family DNA-binding transcriptional regulator [Eubacteriales bacterium]
MLEVITTNIYNVSQKAGVSIATVSRVLNNSPHVSAKTKAHVLAVIEESGYVPNAFARGLGLNSMKTIGLLCPNAADSYLAQALSYLEMTLRSHQYDCLLSCTGRELEARIQGVELLTSKHVDGMILMGSTFLESKEKDNEYIRKAAQQMPVVILNASFTCENVYCVLCDEKRATMEAAQYLLDTGCKNILYLYHSKNHNGLNKLAGYRAAYESRGLPVNESLLRFFAQDSVSIPAVRDYLVGLHNKGLMFDAVLSSEDILSVGAMKYAHVLGKTIPGDLSIIGYNSSPYSLCTEPELTSVDNKLKAVSQQCVATLLGVLEGKEMPQKTVFTGELIKRGSTL